MKRALLPLAAFLVLVGVLAAGLLKGDPRVLPSPLVGRPAPDFRAVTLGGQPLGPRELRGQVWILNVWASWCTACRLEHPVLVDFARSGSVPVYGLNYKDAPAQALDWLARFGDPYAASFSDLDGRIGLDLGVYGAPETFVIDQAGVVRFKHTGALTPEVLREQVLPLVRRLRA